MYHTMYHEINQAFLSMSNITKWLLAFLKSMSEIKYMTSMIILRFTMKALHKQHFIIFFLTEFLNLVLSLLLVCTYVAYNDPPLIVTFRELARKTYMYMYL